MIISILWLVLFCSAELGTVGARTSSSLAHMAHGRYWTCMVLALAAAGNLSHSHGNRSHGDGNEQFTYSTTSAAIITAITSFF